MSKILIVVPSLNGHYPLYINLIKSTENLNEISVLKSNQFIKILSYSLKNKNSKIIFMSGDSDFIISALIKCISPSLNISLIVYYTFEKNFNGFKYFLKKIIVQSLTYINIRLLLLEGDLNLLKYAEMSNVEIICDPLVLNSDKKKEKLKSKNELYYLVAGYLDERKSIKLLFKVLENLSKNDSTKRVITLLGVQTKNMMKFISNINRINNVEIIQKNYRYDNSELEIELSKCDLVWAVYQNHHGSSGFVINAVQFNKPVIFLPSGVLKRFSKELSIDFLPKDLSEREIESCLITLEKVKQYSAQSRTNFLNKRNKKKFIKQILN